MNFLCIESNREIINAVSQISEYWHYYVCPYSKCTKTKEELCALMHALKNKDQISHFSIKDMLLSFNNLQLEQFIKMYDDLPEKDKSDSYIQVYICALILYPELASVINFTDEQIVKVYNDIIIKETTPVETKIFRIKLGKIVCYDYDLLNYYTNASESEQLKYLKIADILIDYIPLCYSSCCTRTKGSLINYLKLLMTTPDDKRILIANYILDAGYSSLYIAKEMCEYFSTLTPEKMKTKYSMAKSVWPDCYIDKTHRFERLFINLLKMNKMPSEDDIIEMALEDCSSRQDIDLCYWGDESEKINEITRSRLNIDGEDDCYDDYDYDYDDYDEKYDKYDIILNPKPSYNKKN